MRFENKNAVVTGGAIGIGRAISLAFARKGPVWPWLIWMRCKPTIRSALSARPVARRFRLRPTLAVPSRSATGKIKDRFGTVDILANNAGSRIVKPFLEHTEEDWRQMLDTNLTGHFLVCKALVPLMLEAGGGHIVNTCSIAGVQGRPNRIGYCAAKGGYWTFTKALAADLCDKNIRVNALAPGMIETPMNQALADDPDIGEKWNTENLVGRWGQPEDVAKAAVFLASADADFMTGTTLNSTAARYPPTYVPVNGKR